MSSQMKKAIIIISILLFGILVSACQPIRPTKDPKMLSGKVIYQDDFSDPKSGWENINGAQGYVGYFRGSYRMMLRAPLSTSLVKANKIYNDSVSEVDVTKATGPDDSTYGLVCRAMNEHNYYVFIISSGGYYGIGKVIEGNGPIMLGTDGPTKLKASDAVKKGNGSNHLRAECISNTLTFIINGQKVSSIQDKDLENGDNGFFAQTGGEAGIDVRYNSLVIKNP
jgi:hypothetical protein